MALEPVLGQGDALGGNTATRPLLAHLDAAHWHRTPAGQVADVLDAETWVRSHLALAGAVLAGVHGPTPG